MYAYVRRRTRDVHEAQDRTQAFFARLLERRAIDRASHERGRFRAFLLTSLKNFLASERERDGAQKRGGAARRLSLDFDSGESRLSLEPAHGETAERHYERRWALTLLDAVTSRLRDEHETAGKERHWTVLKDALAGGREAFSNADAARALGISEEAARQAAHRLRKRFREILREEVSHTVSDPAEIDDEIRALFDALAT